MARHRRRADPRADQRYVKPILKVLSFPITLLSLGLFALVLNALLLLLVAFLADAGRRQLLDRRLPAELHRGLVRRRVPRLDRDQHRVDRPGHARPRAGGSSPEGRARRRGLEVALTGPPERAAEAEVDALPRLAAALRAAARRFGTPVQVTDAGGLATPRRGVRGRRSRTRGCARSRSRRTTSRRSSPDRGARLRRERRVARRVGDRAQGRPPNGRITLEGVGKTDADLRAACASAARGEPLRWIAIESLDEAEALVRIARPRRPRGRQRSTSSSGSTPRWRPETLRQLAVGAGGSKFGMTADELSAAVEVVGAAPGSCPGHPPARRLAAAGGRRLARRSSTRPRAPRAARRDAARVRHARRRRRLPGAAARRGRRRSRRDSRGSCRPCSMRSRPTAGRSAWRSSPAGRSSRAPAGSWRGCSTSASGAGGRSCSIRA